MDKGVSMKIFVVEEDSFCLQIYKGYIQLLGYTDIRLFSDFESMMAVIDEEPDVVFLNKETGGQQGLDIVRKIKQHNQQIYVVYICGFEDSESAMSALKYGAFDYIIKGHLEMESFHNILNKIREINNYLDNKGPVNYRLLFSK